MRKRSSCLVRLPLVGYSERGNRTLERVRTQRIDSSGNQPTCGRFGVLIRCRIQRGILPQTDGEADIRMLNNSLERTFMGPSSLEMRWRISSPPAFRRIPRSATLMCSRSRRGPGIGYKFESVARPTTP